MKWKRLFSINVFKRKRGNKVGKVAFQTKTPNFSKFGSNWLQITDTQGHYEESNQEPLNYNTLLSWPAQWQTVPLVPSLPQWACPWNTGHSTQLCKINCYCRHKTLFSGKCKIISNLKVTFWGEQIPNWKNQQHKTSWKDEQWDLSLTLLFEPFRDASVREIFKNIMSDKHVYIESI